MKDRGSLGYAPNYTNAFLVTLGINLFFWGGFVLLNYGVATVLIATAALDLLIGRFGRPCSHRN